ncbi:MAG: hypothetical protein M1575_03880 [Patescibacteria group bacterium]|nr:hypothetical protein [Patescibacteria group bacterium]MCL5095832.1 hypothetical protein [Patescibacteria group bacterium]
MDQAKNIEVLGQTKGLLPEISRREFAIGVAGGLLGVIAGRFLGENNLQSPNSPDRSSVSLPSADEIYSQGLIRPVEVFRQVGKPFNLLGISSRDSTERWDVQVLKEIPLGFDSVVVGNISVGEDSFTGDGKVTRIKVGSIGLRCSQIKLQYQHRDQVETCEVVDTDTEAQKQLFWGGRRISILKVNQHGIGDSIILLPAIVARKGDTRESLSTLMGIPSEKLTQYNQNLEQNLKENTVLYTEPQVSWTQPSSC